jgi:hypothetical protein
VGVGRICVINACAPGLGARFVHVTDSPGRVGVSRALSLCRNFAIPAAVPGQILNYTGQKSASGTLCLHMADKQRAEESVSTSVRLWPETRKAFEKIATAERRTLGNVLRNALEDYLKCGRKREVHSLRG